MGMERAERQVNYFWEPSVHCTVSPCHQSGRDPRVSCLDLVGFTLEKQDQE